MIQLRITAKNPAEAAQQIEGLAGRISDTSLVLNRFGVQMIRSIEQTFQVGGRPTRWQPWAASTAMREARSLYLKSGKVTRSSKRTAKARTGKILIDTARLKNSITAGVAGTPPILRVGSNVIYSRIHQLGGRAGRGHKSLIPARPFLVVQDEDMDILKQMVAEHITGGGNG